MPSTCKSSPTCDITTTDSGESGEKSTGEETEQQRQGTVTASASQVTQEEGLKFNEDILCESHRW